MIALIERNRSLAGAIKDAILTRWPEKTVEVAANEATALSRLRGECVQLVIADMDTVGRKDFGVVGRVRSVTVAPLIMLGRKDGEKEFYRLLELGADAYFVKPLKMPILCARIASIFRRCLLESAAANPVIVSGKLAFNPWNKSARYKGSDVQLTASESRLLAELMRAGRPLTYEEIFPGIWEDSGAYQAKKRRVRGLVCNLRKKLDARPPRLIITISGKGYLLRCPDPPG